MAPILPECHHTWGANIEICPTAIFKIFIIETFVRDAQTIQKFKIVRVFKSSYEGKTYYWLHLKFVRVSTVEFVQ
jgi:hypothetical protein